ncbi:MAG TPA: hypothetical protein VH640_12620, partial [Bryobacteraceae bacterium]
ENSFNHTLSVYRERLSLAGRGQLELENRDLDTGAPTRPGEYRLADDAYAKLAVKLASQDPAQLDPKLVDNVLAFFHNLDLPYAARKKPKVWSKTVAAVEKLRSLPAVPKDAAAPKVIPAENQ